MRLRSILCYLRITSKFILATAQDHRSDGRNRANRRTAPRFDQLRGLGKLLPPTLLDAAKASGEFAENDPVPQLIEPASSPW